MIEWTFSKLGRFENRKGLSNSKHQKKLRDGNPGKEKIWKIWNFG